MKNAALVYGSTIVFGNIVTLAQYLGYGMSLVGFGFYSYIKSAAAAAPPTAAAEGGGEGREDPEDGAFRGGSGGGERLAMPISAQASVDSFAQLAAMKKSGSAVYAL